MRAWFLGPIVSLGLAGCGASPALESNRGEAQSYESPIVAGDALATAPPAPAAWIDGAPAQRRVLVGSDGQLYIAFWVDAARAAAGGPRSPIDMALVVDTSGSMSGLKIQHARMAAVSLLETLAPKDIVSMYTFADAVTEIAAPTVVGSGLAALIAGAQSMEARGGTNLYDGIRVGQARVAEAPPTHPLRRVVLISDGQANIGPSSPEALGEVAARGTEQGVQVSAIGVGLDYDERTLGALAMQSAGRLYHLEAPEQMSTILREELALLSRTVAVDARLEIEPAPGVEIVGADFVAAKASAGAWTIGLGSLYAGQRREILVRVKLDTTEPGARPLATGRLIYRDPSGAAAPRARSIAVAAAVTADAASAAGSVDHRVQAMIAVKRAAEAQVEAALLLNAGKNVDAANKLDFAEDQLEGAIMATPSSPERNRLIQQAERVGKSREDASKATTPDAARKGALKSYSYAFEDAGYGAPTPSVPPPPRR
jgi:Ca-activated chloride channel homolog